MEQLHHHIEDITGFPRKDMSVRTPSLDDKIKEFERLGVPDFINLLDKHKTVTDAALQPLYRSAELIVSSSQQL